MRVMPLAIGCGMMQVRLCAHAVGDRQLRNAPDCIAAPEAGKWHHAAGSVLQHIGKRWPDACRRAARVHDGCGAKPGMRHREAVRLLIKVGLWCAKADYGLQIGRTAAWRGTWGLARRLNGASVSESDEHMQSSALLSIDKS